MWGSTRELQELFVGDGERCVGEYSGVTITHCRGWREVCGGVLGSYKNSSHGALSFHRLAQEQH